MLKNLITIYVVLFTLVSSSTLANNHQFNLWVSGFKEKAIKSGISKSVVDEFMSKVKFLPKVIEYDRYQPEFYEDTSTYIGKRSNKLKIKQGKILYKNQKKL